MYQLICGCTDDDRIRLGLPLDPGGNVRCFTYGQLFLPVASTHRTNNNWTRMDTDTYL